MNKRNVIELCFVPVRCVSLIHPQVPLSVLSSLFFLSVEIVFLTL